MPISPDLQAGQGAARDPRRADPVRRALGARGELRQRSPDALGAAHDRPVPRAQAAARAPPGRQAAQADTVAAPRLGVVGAGRVGFYTALAFQRAGLIDSCAAFDPAPGAVERTRER
ncbi:hypothetical protein [Streptomyces sp. NBC_01244]|uniref:hypothetical protein n=1 Tax=Streptomyces sp. NBC_01244 TaxID=2903797 RepID=UPI002E0E1B6E|nr:hypothetical protein OG247_07340 [Streptomyces sp. NBC_01244]